MPKFYVESGSLQLVVHAKTSRGAALWAIHRSLSRLLPFVAEESPALNDSERALAALGETITASERGFGRTDAVEFDTFDLVTEWNQLMVALARIENMALQTAA